VHVSFYFFPTHFFQDPSIDILETFPQDLALVKKRTAAISVCWKCPLTKMRGKTPKFCQKHLHSQCGRKTENWIQ